MGPALGSARLRRLLLLTLAAISFWWLVLADTQLWFSAFPRVTDPVDFSLYYAAARIGIGHGWSHIYDYSLQAQQFALLHQPQDNFDWSSLYITPPPMAWLIAPFALLPHALAYYLWVGLLFLAYVVAGFCAVPGSRLARAAVVLFGATTFPLLQPLADGQAALPLTLAVVVSWGLLRANHRWLAGLSLVPLLIKPQTAYLVPLGILLWGDARAFGAVAVGAAVLALISVLSLGPVGLGHWRALLAEEPQHLANQVWTAASLVGVGPLAYFCEAMIAGLTLSIAWISRGASLPLPFAAGLVGSLLAAPYHQASDSIVLVAAFWLYLRLQPPAWHWPWLVFGAVSAVLEPPWGPRPLLIFAVGWLLLMLSLALRHDRRPVQVGTRTTLNAAVATGS